ncbi:MAG: ABC transporter substrate-binding protein, partial [Dehalococcoidia bacterium]
MVSLRSFGMERWIAPMLSSGGNKVNYDYYEYLLRRGPNFELSPMLATAWEWSAEDLTWTFDLREGIQWHDGWGEFTAEDVKFTYDLATGEDSINYMSGLFKRDIESVEVVSPYKVVFNMNKAAWDMPFNLSNVWSQLAIVSKNYIETVGIEEADRNPVSTGPWKFVEHKLGESVTFEAVEDHWRQVPYFKDLTIKLVPEEASQIAGLKAGEIDVALLQMESISEIEAESGLRVIRMPNLAMAVIYLNGQYSTDRESYDPTVPWALPDAEKALKVRKALNLAIDKQAILDNVLYGEGVVAAVYPFFEGQPAFDPALQPTPYDPEEAIRLLAEAGYPDGFDATLALVIDRDWTAPVGEAVAMYWERVGVRVNIQPTDYSTATELSRSRGMAGQAMNLSQRSTYDEPYMQLAGTAHTRSGTNWTVEDPELDVLIDKAQDEADAAKRAVIQAEIRQWMWDNYTVIAIATVGVPIGVSSKVGDWQIIPRYPYL